MDFDSAFIALIGNEGGYSNNPADPGAETMWGITVRVARAWGYTGAMADLPLETAKAIAKSSYWDAAHCDELPDSIRFDVFDTAYNTGVHEAIVLVQRAVGVRDDGVWGPITSSAAHTMGGDACRRQLAAARLDFYTALPTWVTFGRGWARRVAANLRLP